MTSVLMLESFEAAVAVDDAIGPEYSQGYQDGLAAGTAAVQVEIGMLDDTIVQCISDIEFTYAEARAQLLCSLQPLFTTLVEKILPQCVDSGFVAQVAGILYNAAEQDTQPEITLHVHPQNVAQIANQLASLEKDVAVKPDQTLSTHAAWLLQGRVETFLDLDSLLEDITEALNTISLEQDGSEANG
ncbi:hypothetical protein [Yoonia sediminilitoris]|uniref:Flagellar assembly protein FliH n=1 Tax=Yoonia sediminilitoris TaxID=1286148 RepID=A0A2T6KA51_9RHOB|nr:hypothetical protein [Yoonia sediminilitoris]PUB11613.1 hypothetical protein C8N45_113132 [Yoonia sediminilitoris]RCW91813.1 hypothetical protein DFP92_113132 [Yoonia sediminilitoris]